MRTLLWQYSVEYTAPFAGAPTVWRQIFDFHKRLSGGRTLRFSSDMFKFSGSGDHLRATSFGLGVNRMSLGIDGPDGSLDVLDSQINITPLSFSGYVMRGFHLVSTPTSRFRGIEIFAGLARPSVSMFDMNQGRVMGAIVPIAKGEFWRVRAGMFSVYAGENNRLEGRTVWNLTAAPHWASTCWLTGSSRMPMAVCPGAAG